MELELDWTMKVDGARLRIDYTFHNRSKRPVVVVDQLTVGPKHAPDAIIVMNADGLAKTVAFVRAFVRTNEKLVYTPFPGGRAVAAGADLKGTAFADLPLHMWHNFSKLPPLTGDATQAVLEIGYLEEPVTFRGLKLANATLQIPVEMAKQKLLRSKSLPLPP